MKFKKILSGVTAIAATVACLSITAFADTNKSGNFEYEVLSDGTVKCLL